MYQIVAKRATNWLVQGGSVSEENREVYEFGLDKLFTMLSNILVAAVIGLLFGMFAQMLTFYATYIALRVYAGGYHADKPLRCFFLSIGSIVPCLLAIRFQQMWNVPLVFYGLLGLGIFTLVALGPVEHKNKKLDEVEKRVYRFRLLRNLMIVTAGAIVLSVISLPNYAAAVLCGILLVTITAIIGKVKLMSQT